jgi:hypothetical protein
MAGLRQQIQGIIKTCETAIGAKNTPALDRNTIDVAAAILKQAKEDLPNDKILAAANLNGMLNWAQILSVMQTVLHSLPIESAGRQVGGSGGGGDAGWMR